MHLCYMLACCQIYVWSKFNFLYQRITIPKSVLMKAALLYELVLMLMIMMMYGLKK